MSAVDMMAYTADEIERVLRVGFDMARQRRTVPTWERKIRVFGNWFLNFVLHRDVVSLEARVAPRAAFEEFASRPKPAADSAPAAAAPATTAAPAKVAVPVK